MDEVYCCPFAIHTCHKRYFQERSVGLLKQRSSMPNSQIDQRQNSNNCWTTGAIICSIHVAFRERLEYFLRVLLPIRRLAKFGWTHSTAATTLYHRPHSSTRYRLRLSIWGYPRRNSINCQMVLRKYFIWLFCLRDTSGWGAAERKAYRDSLGNTGEW